MGAIADVKAAGDVDAVFGEHLDFGNESGGIDHNAGPNYGVLLGAEDATGDELEDKAVTADDHRVPGIMPAGNARDVVKATGKIVNDLSFTFVSPLRADHDDRFHSEALLSQS